MPLAFHFQKLPLSCLPLLGRRLGLESLEPRMLLTGTWTPLSNLAPTANSPRLALLSDGSVLVSVAASNGGSAKLTPNAAGSYVDGTWSSAAGMSLRGGGSQIVLTDGRVFLLGGVNSGVSVNRCELYTPDSNLWTTVADFPGTALANGPTMLLSDGRVLAGSISGPQTYIYNLESNTWSTGPMKLYGDSSNHESWTKLADGSILSYDVNSNAGEAQRLDPFTMTWIDAGQRSELRSKPAPVLISIWGLACCCLMDGCSNSAAEQTAIYTPSTAPGGLGTWDAGPLFQTA